MKKFRKIIIGLTTILGGMGVLMLLGLPALGIKPLAVQTGSMAPHIPTGSMVFVKSVPASALKVGDVITYSSMQKKGETVTHRITQEYLIDGRVPGFVTKGDANKVPDAPIVGGQVKGKVIFSTPYLGTAMKALRSWPAIIVLVYLPALWVMIGEMRRLSAYYRSQIPYVLAGYKSRLNEKKLSSMKMASVAVFFLLGGAFLFASPVLAQFQTNSVTLANGNIFVTTTPPPNPGGGGNNTNNNCQSNNNVSVNTSTNQTSTTGNANSSGNTNGQGATSGDATNNNSTNININVTGC